MNEISRIYQAKPIKSIERAPQKQPTSVLPVFGQNLRILTGFVGTQTKVAAELDIGRIQFQRYLRGESFPKPNVLKKICTYFQVDARILTEPLTNTLLQQMQQAYKPQASFPTQSAWLTALAHAAPNQNYFNYSNALPDGLYAVWQWCAARKNTIIRMLIQISQLDGVKVTRGFVSREFFSPGVAQKDREFRGICLSLGAKGFVITNFYGRPSQIITTAYVSRMHLSERYPDVLVGYTTISRDELPDMPRLSRVIIERIEPTPANLLKQAHTPVFYKIDEIPDVFSDLLTAPVA